MKKITKNSKNKTKTHKNRQKQQKYNDNIYPD